MPAKPKAYRVVIRNLRKPGLILDWDMKGESSFATLKGANSRRIVVARKFPQYDNAVLTPASRFLHYTEATHPHLAIAKPIRPKKRKLVPRNPNYGE